MALGVSNMMKDVSHLCGLYVKSCVIWMVQIAPLVSMVLHGIHISEQTRVD